MQNQEARPKMRKRSRFSPTRALGWTLFGLGATALVVSVVSVSSILAFIGLGLVFWGAILTYVQTEEYVPENLLEATAAPLLASLNQAITDLGLSGRPIYLPPKYLSSPDDNKAYIPKQRDAGLPTLEQLQRQENWPFGRNPQGLLITPPGDGLARLFEKTLNTNFMRTDLEYLRRNVPKLLIEDLEIATEVEIELGTTEEPDRPVDSRTETTNDRVHVKITTLTYEGIFKQAKQLSSIHALGSPLSSALACALAKATGKPIVLEDERTSEDGQTTEADYRILEEEPTER